MNNPNRLVTIIPVAIVIVVVVSLVRQFSGSESQNLTLRSASKNGTSAESIDDATKPSEHSPRVHQEFGSIGQVAPFRPIQTHETNDSINATRDTENQPSSSPAISVLSNPKNIPAPSAKSIDEIASQHDPKPLSKESAPSLKSSAFAATRAQPNQLESHATSPDSNDDMTTATASVARLPDVTSDSMQTAFSTEKESQDRRLQSAAQSNPAFQPNRHSYRGLPPNVVNHALKRIEYGGSLARRGATHGARQEFIAAIRSIAEACDIQQKSGSFHSESLSQGLTAFREAEDFASINQQVNIQVALAATVNSHQSNVIDAERAATMNANDVVQEYFLFAQRKITESCGPFPISSYALYSLGKLQSVSDKMQAGQGQFGKAKSIVMHRAALIADPNNYRSANELGVLLAQAGSWQDARKVLQHGLAIHPTAEMWNNLAIVHQQLNEHQLAQQARNESQILVQSQANQQSAHAQVQWVEQNTFDRNAQAPPMSFQQSQQTPTQQPAQAENWWSGVGNIFK